MVKLGLGTVQIGMPYGPRKEHGALDQITAFEILKGALAAEVQLFDTAAAYGESEERIGEFVKNTAWADASRYITTKIPSVDKSVWSNEDKYRQFLLQSISSSKAKLQLDSLGLLQFHQCDVDFLSSRSVEKAMIRLIEDRLCESIGVSVYHPEQAQAAMSLEVVSALQIPLNVVDTRFLGLELTRAVKKKGVRLIVRSVFMQGLLIDDLSLRRDIRRLTLVQDLRNKCLDVSQRSGRRLSDLAMSFVVRNCEGVVDTVLVGVDSLANLQQNIALYEKAAPLSDDILSSFREARDFALEHDILTPLTW